MKSFIATLCLLPSLALAATTASSKIPKTVQGNLILWNYDEGGSWRVPTMATKVPLPAAMKALPQYKNTNFTLLKIDSYPGMGGSPSSVAQLLGNRFNYTQTGFVDPKGNYLQIAPTGNLIGVGKLFTTAKEKNERTSWSLHDDGTIRNIYLGGCIGSKIYTVNGLHQGYMIFVPGTVTTLVKQNKCIKFNFRDARTGKDYGVWNTNGQSFY